MTDRFFVVLNGSWFSDVANTPRRVEQHLTAIGSSPGHLVDQCSLLVKFRDRDSVVTDVTARLQALGSEFYIKSEQLSSWLSAQDARGRLVVLFFEGTKDDARCVVSIWNPNLLGAIEDEDRLRAFGLPPADSVIVDGDQLVSVMYDAAVEQDRKLFSVHADRFLDSPSIMVALFAHLMSIRTEDNIRFPIQVKKIAEQLRAVLDGRSEYPRIERVKQSHLELWAEVQGRTFSFLDGGAARIGSLPGLSPLALRVGVYSVRPGVDEEDGRESWTMKPYVVADLLDRDRRPAERPEPRRLQEASRYTLEALTALLHLRAAPQTAALLSHGPLVNQFTQYDEGEPNYIPFLSPAFLEHVGISREEVENRITALPSDRSGPMWNQFMAIYGYVMLGVYEASVPIAGVVERPTGRAVANALLVELERQGVYTAAYTRRVSDILEQYDITDDFLFGCMLRQGEYLTPVRVLKNNPRKARPAWNSVVRQFPQPAAMLIKSEETDFPFRVELNEAAQRESAFIARFLYHTARLLPRYAFPVGLDIADRYAKIPDWLSRGVSAELSATVLRQAMKTGDPRLVTQLRLFLARGPRDFFYRPSITP
jgi:hypothetical protein